MEKFQELFHFIAEQGEFYHLNGVDDEQIREAEEKLGLQFPKEYEWYLKQYGAISFYGTEWTGLGVEGPVNVVTATQQEREWAPRSFPRDCFVLDIALGDGSVVIANEEGTVYYWSNKHQEWAADTLSDYLEICRERNRHA